MRAYVLTTSAVFVLLVLAHAVRVAMEGPHLLREPFFVLATVIPAGLSFWAWRLLRRGRGEAGPADSHGR